MKIAIDFDGTIVQHCFPAIGPENPGAFKWMKKWQEAGAKLILWTMRSDGQEVGDVLSQAVEYCLLRGIKFDAVNEGIGDREWTTSPKAHAHIFVDDAAFGCPLRSAIESDRPMVNWFDVGPEIEKRILEEA
jgi:hypothetical protein